MKLPRVEKKPKPALDLLDRLQTLELRENRLFSRVTNVEEALGRVSSRVTKLEGSMYHRLATLEGAFTDDALVRKTLKDQLVALTKSITDLVNESNARIGNASPQAANANKYIAELKNALEDAQKRLAEVKAVVSRA